MTGFSICLVKFLQGFECLQLKILGLRIRQDCECARVTQGTEYALKIPQYAWTYLNKQSSEYARILNVSDAVHSIRSLYKLLSNYHDRCILRHCQTFKIECFVKTIMPECRHTIRKFSWQSKFCGTWALR